MVAKAEETHDLTSRARYVVGAFEDLEFKDGRFDRVFSMEALYYASDLDKALEEIARVTKIGGEAHLLIDRYQESSSTESWADDVGLPMAWLAQAEWEDALRRVGFGEVSSSRVIDSRGPGEGASAEKVARMAEGTLWLKGLRR